MSELKATPGPWKIGAYESGRMAVDGANGEEVTGYIDIEDAHLIAAAPELYNFVEEYLEAWENGMAGDSYLFYLAQAVRGKARGEHE